MTAEVEYVEELRKVDAFTSVTVRVPKPAEQPEAAQAEEPQQEQPEAAQAVKRARKP